ncbi:hypothetical protein BDV10DRAFT_158786 [Aspergillus recurvatus]
MPSINLRSVLTLCFVVLKHLFLSYEATLHNAKSSRFRAEAKTPKNKDLIFLKCSSGYLKIDSFEKHPSRSSLRALRY